MKKENGYNEIDKLLRERFGEHTVRPEKELWEKIEHWMQPRTVPFLKYSRLKIAFAASAAAIAGLVFIVFTLNQPKTTPTEYSDIQQMGKNIPPENIQPKKETLSTVAKNKPVQKMQGKTPVLISENRQGKIQPENNFNATTPDKQQENAHSSLQKVKMLTVESVCFQDFALLKKANVSSKTEELASVKTNTRPAKTKKIRYNQPSKRRYISAKKYYAQKLRNRGFIKPGSNFEKFGLRVVFSPSYSTRTVNNLQNVTLADYDPAFFNRIESGKIALNGGLELSCKINSKWSIYSGLDFSQYSRQIQNAQNNYTIVSGNEVIIPSSAGDINISGVGVGELSTKSQFETKLKIGFLNVPVVARHYFTPNFYADAGFKYSYLLADKTSVSLNDAAVKFTVAKIEGIQKHYFGLVLGTGIEHVTHSGIRFQIGPEITMNLNNLNPSARVISKPVSLELRTGIYLGKYKQL